MLFLLAVLFSAMIFFISDVFNYGYVSYVPTTQLRIFYEAIEAYLTQSIVEGRVLLYW